jgi:hypothetical protein
MRVLVSIAVAALVYPIFAFVSLEPNPLEWDLAGRAFLVFLTIFAGAMCYTFPGWDERS